MYLLVPEKTLPKVRSLQCDLKATDTLRLHVAVVAVKMLLISVRTSFHCRQRLKALIFQTTSTG